MKWRNEFQKWNMDKKELCMHDGRYANKVIIENGRVCKDVQYGQNHEEESRACQ